MNNEKYNQIIDEAYENYQNKRSFANKDNVRIPHTLSNGMTGQISRPFAKEEFINKCKTDQEFSEKWGLKIEERELSLVERLRLVNYDKNRFNSIDEWIEWYKNEPDEFYYMGINYTKETALTDLDVPTKLITITYNNETIEVYE